MPPGGSWQALLLGTTAAAATATAAACALSTLVVRLGSKAEIA